ncbi:MAG: radical SAM protein [Hadesarchaea archaeon]|nr:radical SAM protein [Hadesarchaea archaeon]
MVTMRIYHITYSPEVRTANLYFHGCDFYCLGCIRKKNPYDLCLKEKPDSWTRFLNLDEVLEILNRLGAKRAILLGGEPTLDSELPTLTMELHRNGIYNILLTNGHKLDERLLESVDRICVSIKAYSKKLHKKYTGKSNERVLQNFEKIYRSGTPLSSESVYIPSLIETEEIEKIARFIASIDPEIPYHIDAYIPIDNRWRAPTPKEIETAVAKAKMYLRNVTCLRGCEKLKYEVFNVYP